MSENNLFAFKGWYNTVVYNRFDERGVWLGKFVYHPTNKADYDRVSKVFDDSPECYRLVDEYGYERA